MITASPHFPSAIIVAAPHRNLVAIYRWLYISRISAGLLAGAFLGGPSYRRLRKINSVPAMLSAALERRCLTISYQPIVNIADRKIVAVETLMR